MESSRLSLASSTLSSSSSSSVATKSLFLLQVFSLLAVQISSAENQGCPDSLVSCPCGRDLMKEVDVPIEMCRNFTFGWFFPKLRCLTCHSLIPEAVCRPYRNCADCRLDGISSCIPYKKDREIRRNHCPPPLLLPNGHITVDKEPQPGSVVKYKCDNRYVLKGQPKRTCGRDFHWTGSPPTCLKTMCPPPAGLKHGRIHYSKNQLVFNVNDRVSYSCDEDYLIYGETVRICGADGKWSGSEPFCSKVISCKDPGIPNEALRTAKRPIGSRVLDDFPIGTVLSFKCPSLYKLYGSANRKCLPTSEWTGSQPTCVPECGRTSKHDMDVENILGGKSYPRVAMPWHAAISTDIGLNEMLLRCGGTLISDRWVLTAAHCITASGSKDSLPLRQIMIHISKVYANNSLDDSYVQKFQADDVYIHDYYQPSSKRNDIALIYLSRKVKLGPFAKPICLPDISMLSHYAKEDTKGFVSGWGLTEQKVRASRLLTTKVSVFKDSDCLQYIRTDFSQMGDEYLEKVFCAGTRPTEDRILTDSQKYDSGGGLVFRTCRDYVETWYLEGIVNWGVKNGVGVYIRVFNYINWINSVI